MDIQQSFVTAEGFTTDKFLKKIEFITIWLFCAHKKTSVALCCDTSKAYDWECYKPQMWVIPEQRWRS